MPLETQCFVKRVGMGTLAVRGQGQLVAAGQPALLHRVAQHRSADALPLVQGIHRHGLDETRWCAVMGEVVDDQQGEGADNLCSQGSDEYPVVGIGTDPCKYRARLCLGQLPAILQQGLGIELQDCAEVVFGRFPDRQRRSIQLPHHDYKPALSHDHEACTVITAYSGMDRAAPSTVENDKLANDFLPAPGAVNPAGPLLTVLAHYCIIPVAVNVVLSAVSLLYRGGPVSKLQPGKKKSNKDIADRETRFFDSHVAYAIIALANLITQNTLKHTLAGTKLSVNEWRILRLTYIYQSVCAADVITVFGLDKTTTGRALTGLREAKLIRSAANSLDRRQSNFTLSAAGKRLHDRIVRQDNISDRAIEKVLSKAEIAAFHTCMHKLRAHVRNRLKQGS